MTGRQLLIYFENKISFHMYITVSEKLVQIVGMFHSYCEQLPVNNNLVLK